MSDPSTTPPVVVNASTPAALPAYVITVLRYLATLIVGSSFAAPIVAWLSSHGLTFGKTPADLVYGALAFIAIAAYGVYDTWHGKQKQAALANQLPDNQAVVK